MVSFSRYTDALFFPAVCAVKNSAIAGCDLRRDAVSRRLMRAAAFMACALFVACVAAGVAGEKSKKPVFDKMDTNGDKQITDGEFNAYVIACPELGLTKAVFQGWDVDKDGVVTVAEFQKVYPMKESVSTEPKEKM